MNEERLTRRSIAIIVVTGVITGFIALLATMAVMGSSQATFTASARLAMLPAKTLPAEQVPSYWESLSGGGATRVAADVYGLDRWKTEAATAAGVAPETVVVEAGVVESSQLMNISVQANSGAVAEQIADKIVADATPLVQEVSGPYEIRVLQSAAGTATPSGVSATQLYAVVFIGGLLVGAGAALIIARARSRSDDDELDYPDSGEFRAVQSGAYRPVNPPPPGRSAPPNGAPPNGSNGSNGGGPYGPPRRPLGDPRAPQQQPPR